MLGLDFSNAALWRKRASIANWTLKHARPNRGICPIFELLQKATDPNSDRGGKKSSGCSGDPLENSEAIIL
jgi:hypothetical protein